MTTAHVEKFAELVGKDPALLAKLGLDKVNADAAAAAASAAAFITNAVKEAKALGLEFTEDEAHAFMDAEAKAAASGELSDTQLETVAGGKSVDVSSTYKLKPKVWPERGEGRGTPNGWEGLGGSMDAH
jgi:hypothetical protein